MNFKQVTTMEKLKKELEQASIDLQLGLITNLQYRVISDHISRKIASNGIDFKEFVMQTK